MIEFDTDLLEFSPAKNRAGPPFDQSRIDSVLRALWIQDKESASDTPPDPPSTDEKTEEWLKCHAAELRGAALFAQFRREHQVPIPHSEEEYCSVGFAEFLLSHKPIWSTSTWRHARIAATYLLEKFPDSDRDLATNLIARRGQPILRTSDRSMLSLLPHDEFDEILRTAERIARHTVISAALADWMRAGISTALGPSDWTLTELVGTSLYVFDARLSCPGEPGTFRVLDVSALDEKSVRALRATSERCHRWVLDGRFTKRKSELDHLLATTYESLNPRVQLSCTLESIQLQALANFTAYTEPAAVSALIGDVFVDLPNLNYRHAKKAWDAHLVAIPRPELSEVRRFRRIRAAYDGHREIRNIKKARQKK